MVFWASVNAECLRWRRGRQISLILALLLLLFERRREVTTLWRCTNAFIINTQTDRQTHTCVSVRDHIFGTTRSIFAKFLCMLPMVVAHKTASRLRIFLPRDVIHVTSMSCHAIVTMSRLYHIVLFCIIVDHAHMFVVLILPAYKWLPPFAADV